MKAKITTMPCRHSSNATYDEEGIAQQPTDRYWVIELTDLGTDVGRPWRCSESRVTLSMPMSQYPIDENGYEDHDAAKRILEGVLKGVDTEQQETVP